MGVHVLLLAGLLVVTPLAAAGHRDDGSYRCDGGWCRDGEAADDGEDLEKLSTRTTFEHRWTLFFEDSGFYQGGSEVRPPSAGDARGRHRSRRP